MQRNRGRVADRSEAMAGKKHSNTGYTWLQ